MHHATLHDQSVAANSGNHHENLALHASSDILSYHEPPLRGIKLVTIKVTGALVFLIAIRIECPQMILASRQPLMKISRTIYKTDRSLY